MHSFALPLTKMGRNCLSQSTVCFVTKAKRLYFPFVSRAAILILACPSGRIPTSFHLRLTISPIHIPPSRTPYEGAILRCCQLDHVAHLVQFSESSWTPKCRL